MPLGFSWPLAGGFDFARKLLTPTKMNLQNKVNGFTVAIADLLKLDGHPDFMAATDFAATWMTANLASLRMRNGFGRLVFLPDVTPANLAAWIAKAARDNPLPSARAFAAAFDRQKKFGA